MSEDFCGTDFPVLWCKRFGMPCSLDDGCCGEMEEIRVVSFEHAQDVLRDVVVERDRYRDALTAALGHLESSGLLFADHYVAVRKAAKTIHCALTDGTDDPTRA